MRYAGIIKDDINNGRGVGLTLFTQGCPHHCKGCHNPETWNFNSGKPFTDETFNEIIEYFRTHLYATRFTLSGGDPLCSGAEITELCKRIKEMRPEVSIWAYTGFIYENIINSDLLPYIDVLVDGPFILEQRDITLQFRGSSNQRIIDLNKTRELNKIVLWR